MVEISKEFWEKWNFPNCAGVIDGKHIRIFSPKKSESLFFSYKDLFSIVLLAIVDANCKFIFVDIGLYMVRRVIVVYLRNQKSQKK